jgi:hypothetical protein
LGVLLAGRNDESSGIGLLEEEVIGGGGAIDIGCGEVSEF